MANEKETGKIFEKVGFVFFLLGLAFMISGTIEHGLPFPIVESLVVGVLLPIGAVIYCFAGNGD